MFIFILAAAAAAVLATSVAPQPWPPLSGGDFSGPPVPLSPDPLVRYVFNASTSVDSLYVFNVFPVSAFLLEGTPSASFNGWESLSSPAETNVVVSGAGGVGVDFGTELPAWLEFDSPDLSDADAARLLLATGEYNAVDIIGTTPKQKAPVRYNTTFRLETNAELYEGVRFGFLTLAAPPASPFTITALRAVTQTKPVNYTGSYSADSLSTRIYYAAAYTVRTNLEKDYIGAILEDRGDRISWAGDAHVAQATALAVFGNTWDVLQNLNVTGKTQNGIASYSLYFVDSVADYFIYTADAGVVATYGAEAARILDSALASFNDTKSPLTFFGWDDRIGSGFQNASCDEARATYRFVLVTVLARWSTVLAATGDAAGAAARAADAAAALRWARAAAAARAGDGSPWWSALGVHAAADAINTQRLTPDETSALLTARLNDTTSFCSLSNFNSFWSLKALANAGALDRGAAAIELCWGAEVAMGGTTFWEISSRDWAAFTSPGDPVPNGENGYTSLCHPWSAAPAAWLAAHAIGVRVQLPGSPLGRVLVAPHVSLAAAESASSGAPMLTGAVPVSVGDTRVDARVEVNVRRGAVTVAFPRGAAGTLIISRILLARAGVSAAALRVGTRGSVELTCAIARNGGPPRATLLPLFDASADEALVVAGFVAPLEDEILWTRSPVVALAVDDGETITITFDVDVAAASAVAPFAPFPPTVWRAAFLGADALTAGDWQGTYGALGGVLFGAGDAAATTDFAFFPAWVVAVEPHFSFLRGAWAPGAGGGEDVRLPVDPRNATGPRAAGYLTDQMGGDPTFVIDVTLGAGAPAAFHIALYCVDYDTRGRRGTVALLDGATFDPLAPIVEVREYERGVWLSWEVSGPFRLRISQTRGDNAVVNALLFDASAQ